MDYTPNQLVFIDESASNKRTRDRKYRYALQGLTPRVKKLLKRSERYSVLPAYTVNGYIACMVYQGGINKDLFEQWLEQDVLSKCNRWPRDRSVLVIDNCKIHTRGRVLELCR